MAWPASKQVGCRQGWETSECLQLTDQVTILEKEDKVSKLIMIKTLVHVTLPAIFLSQFFVFEYILINELIENVMWFERVDHITIPASD